MSPTVSLVLLGSLLTFGLIRSRWDTWFQPGWTLPLRLLAFGYAGAGTGMVVIFCIGTTLTALGGVL